MQVDVSECKWMAGLSEMQLDLAAGRKDGGRDVEQKETRRRIGKIENPGLGSDQFCLRARGVNSAVTSRDKA
jgi:hypothetical protein